jgi:nucleotide-binding universal stress UspA family protein
MIKTILVGLDGSEHSRTAGRYALWLGERFGATVVGLHVVDIVSIEGSFFHDISGSLGFEPYLDFSSKMREVLHERGKGLLQEFAEQAAQSGVRADTLLGMGVVANEIAEYAKTADLVVIGHRGVNEKFSTGLLGSTAESVTRKCPKPVFVCTLDFRPSTNPLLAYDGSQRAAAAMQSAAEFCTTLSLPLTVLTVSKDEAAGRKILDEAEKYMSSYQLRTSFVLQQTGNAPERITNFLKEREHDLLFIGAYGHSRIIEMVLGSTTEYVMRNSPCAVFLNR